MYWIVFLKQNLIVNRPDFVVSFLINKRFRLLWKKKLLLLLLLLLFLKDPKLIVKFFQENTVFVSVVVLIENPTAKTSEHLLKGTVLKKR